MHTHGWTKKFHDSPVKAVTHLKTKECLDRILSRGATISLASLQFIDTDRSKAKLIVEMAGQGYSIFLDRFSVYSVDLEYGYLEQVILVDG